MLANEVLIEGVALTNFVLDNDGTRYIKIEIDAKTHTIPIVFRFEKNVNLKYDVETKGKQVAIVGYIGERNNALALIGSNFEVI